LQEAVKSKQQQCFPVTKINDNPHFVEIAIFSQAKGHPIGVAFFAWW